MKNTFTSSCKNYFINIDEISAIVRVYAKSSYTVRLKRSEAWFEIPATVAEELFEAIKKVSE